MNKNEEIAAQVLADVGGKENVDSVFHCATRLRFRLKNEKEANDEAIKAIDGVYGTIQAGGMYQVIIGQNVDSVYDEVCRLGGFAKNKAIDEAPDDLPQAKEKEGFSWKKFGNSLMAYFAGTVTPVINLIMGAALWNVVATVLGPSMLNVISTDSGLYITCNIIYNAVFYFIPIYMGYGAAKTIGISNPVWGMVIGGLTIVPTFVNLAATQETLSLFNLISVPIADYGTNVLPILLGVVVLKYLLDFLKKVIPSMVYSLCASFIVFFVMAIVMLGVFCPLGTYVGGLLGDLFISMGEANFVLKVLASGIIGGIWTLVTLCGMHLPIYFAALVGFLAVGYDTLAFPCMMASLFELNGMVLAACFVFKNKNDKAMAITAAVSAWIGGICEPALYGIGMRSKRTIAIMVGGGAISGIIMGLVGPMYVTTIAGASIFTAVTWAVGSTTANVVKAAICIAAATLIGFFGIIFFGDLNGEKEKAKS